MVRESINVSGKAKYGSCELRADQLKPGKLSTGCHQAEDGQVSIVDSAEQRRDKELGWLQRAATRIPCLGILLALGASFFLGSAGVLVKMTTSVHGIQVAVFR